MKPEENLQLVSGFECTRAQCQPGIPYNADAMRGLRHTSRFNEDFQLVQKAGIGSLRYPIFWPGIQKDLAISLHKCDWQWQDNVMQSLLDNGITDVIADGMHHTNCPSTLSFEDDSFADRYVEFTLAYLERYPWLKRVNLFNEPLATLLFCGLEGVWYPFSTDDRRFVKMSLNVGRAICMLSRELRNNHPQIKQFMNDCCESHKVTNKYSCSSETHSFSNWMNQRRFLMVKLVLGLINEEMPEDGYLHTFLTKHGCTENELRWFRENPARIDEYGLDYYPMHEHQYHDSGDLSMTPELEARGLADIVINDYWPRLKGHVGKLTIGETNLHGCDPDKITWLKFIAAECEKCRDAGIEIDEICWYGFIGGRYWSSLLRRANRRFDDFGICWVEPKTYERKHWLFFNVVQRITQGALTFEELPAYPLQKPLDRKLGGFVRGPMSEYNWCWQERFVK